MADHTVVNVTDLVQLARVMKDQLPEHTNVMVAVSHALYGARISFFWASTAGSATLLRHAVTSAVEAAEQPGACRCDHCAEALGRLQLAVLALTPAPAANQERPS
jgi:hypothetical protein